MHLISSFSKDVPRFLFGSSAHRSFVTVDKEKLPVPFHLRVQQWVAPRIRCLIVLICPSLLLVTAVRTGLLRPSSSRRSQVLIGLPFRRYQAQTEGVFPLADTPIPWQLVATGKAASLGQLPANVQGNVENTLSLNPGMRMRYFSDEDCHDYIQNNFDRELADIYRREAAGHFRGDICRAAVLLKEGGFYTDVDLQVKLPFAKMVDNTTSFMSVFTLDGAILNAMIATRPGSEILNVTLKEVRRWYKGTESSLGLEEHGEGEWMGTVTLRRGMEAFMKTNCPDVSLMDRKNEQVLQWSCGQHVLRFYQEDRLDCWTDTPTEECPDERKNSYFDGLQYGVFVPGTREIVAWPRVVTCEDWWCGGR